MFLRTVVRGFDHLVSAGLRGGDFLAIGLLILDGVLLLLVMVDGLVGFLWVIRMVCLFIYFFYVHLFLFEVYLILNSVLLTFQATKDDPVHVFFFIRGMVRHSWIVESI